MADLEQEGGGSPQDRAVVDLSRAERRWAYLLASASAVLYAWAAWTLPWLLWTPFSVVCVLAACLNGMVVVVGLARPAFFLVFWRLSAFASLAVLSVATWTLIAGASYLLGAYGSLGQGLSAALVAVWGLFVLVTLPVAVWVLVRSGGVRAKGLFRYWPWAAVALLLGAGGQAYREASLQVLSAELSSTELESLAGALTERPSAKRLRINPKRAANCPAPPGAGRHTLLLAYTSRAGRSANDCFQSPDRNETLSLSRTRLKSNAAPGGVVKLDWVVAANDLTSIPRFVGALALRPGLDGACLGARCFAPWHLLVRRDFIRNAPLSFISDLKLGVSLKRLARALSKGSRQPKVRVSGLQRIATQSYVAGPGQSLTRLRRMRPVGPMLGGGLPAQKRALTRAGLLAEHQILSAQLPDGKFRYSLDPFTGRASKRNFSLARQAGTVLVLCELGADTPEVTAAIISALELLKSHERIFDSRQLSALSLRARAKRMRVGDSALPLAAFARCRSRVGGRFDSTLIRLARFLRKMQRPNGQFYPEYQLAKTEGEGGVRAGVEPLYVSGQAVLAFLMLSRLELSAGVEPQALAAAAQRSMDFASTEHWSSALYPFFFIEENWHCIAAREALSYHRDEAYERFCLDYIRFKSRLILDQQSGVDEEFVGGLGFGNIVPPHNTGAAGFGEALAAAIEIKKVRGERALDDVTRLRQVMTFLMRQQWTPNNNFAGTESALGAISEHTHSPTIRIDFVQHAWAALGHGGRAAGIL